MTQNQFQLFKERRFLPYFITQFLGAFNDNIFKTAIAWANAISDAYVERFGTTVNTRKTYNFDLN